MHGRLSLLRFNHLYWFQFSSISEFLDVVLCKLELDLFHLIIGSGWHHSY